MSGASVLEALSRAIYARCVYADDPAGWKDSDVALLRSLREAMVDPHRLVRCANCGGSGGVPDIDGESEVGCQYCETTGKVIVLPSSLLSPAAGPTERKGNDE